MSERADCAVTALAAVCGVTYRRAYDALDACGRKPGCRTHTSTLKEAASLLGYVLIQYYPESKHTLQTVQFKLGMSGSHILFIRGHFVAYTGGGVDPTDWSYGTASRINKYYKAIPKRRVVS